MVDAEDSKSSAARHVGSSPTSGTTMKSEAIVLRHLGPAKRMWAAQRVNFLYFTRFGAIESAPSRRTLSAS